MFTQYKNLLMMTLRSELQPWLQNQTGPNDNIKLTDLNNDSDVNKKVREIKDLLNRIKDDDWAERNYADDLGLTTKAQILQAWLWKDLAVLEQNGWLVDQQVVNLLKKLNSVDASKEEVKNSVISMLDDIKSEIKAKNIWARDDDDAKNLLDSTISNIGGMDETEFWEFKDKLKAEAERQAEADRAEADRKANYYKYKTEK